MKRILTFDIGTTSVKTCLFGEDLALLASDSREYALETGPGGVVELDPEVYWEAVKGGLARVAPDPAARAEIAAVCVTTQGETMIPVDREGRPLGKAIVWLDSRAGEEADILRGLSAMEGHYERTGVSAIDGMTPLSKLLWLARRAPEVYRRADKMLLLGDFIACRLTGRMRAEPTLLSTTGWYDIRAGRYLDELLEQAGLNPALLPEIAPTGGEIATVNPEAARETGLSTGCRVVAGAMDQVAAAIGGGNLRPGVVTETTGTAMVLMTAADERCFDDPARVNIYRHALPGLYYVIPFCVTAGVVLKWFKDNFCQPEIDRARAVGEDVYDLLGAMAAQCPPGADGLIALPYFDGMLQPEKLPRLRGTFVGASLNTGRAHFVRAIFEGVACMMRENLELLRAMGVEPREVRSFGGGARSAVWQQIKADISGTRIVTLQQTECASLGAAMLAAVALGWYPDLERAARANRPARVCEPDPARAEESERIYARYRRAFEATKGLY